MASMAAEILLLSEKLSVKKLASKCPACVPRSIPSLYFLFAIEEIYMYVQLRNIFDIRNIP
jgi:hypothetical protein